MAEYKPKKEEKFYKPSIRERISETDTRVKILDPQLKGSGWKEENIPRSDCLK